MKTAFGTLARLHYLSRRAWARLLMTLYKNRLKKCGRNVVFDPVNSVITYESVEIGDHVFIGGGAWFSSSEAAPVRIGSCVMFGPGVTLLCGDHAFRERGVPMYFVKKDAPSKHSAAIDIKDDVWIGANVTVLKGVTIGRGSVIAAGSVVNKPVPEYAIVAGVPAKVIGQRFDDQALSEHKALLEKNGFLP
ncbi:chloramphenicol acetyltransferase [Legionella geestiana]|uniref:Chloramphenicol acetyltransferase n=1 Tax=Legionella geestiana TaxID=45065 RepID=A0A0W0U9R7_9GAMM|nr:acyltransferase [Legionella geestiana]KTD04513.1 chloramphenicol acetyltransferase [Legionella geestiana]QBS12282.1 acyltransferase [Legionella geestiana]STX52983.1 chloramphenicol acetyltransferase [Legionella geestiana]